MDKKEKIGIILQEIVDEKSKCEYTGNMLIEKEKEFILGGIRPWQRIRI